MNRIAFFILLTVNITSCHNIKIRNLTGRIVLEEVTGSCDTVDFYIKQIKLSDVEKSKPFWIEHSHSLGIIISISNKFNNSIRLSPNEHFLDECFFGILPLEMGLNDTISFINLDDPFPKLIESGSNVEYEVWSVPLEKYFDVYALNNIDPMLNLIQRMKFYYVPTLIDETIVQDTVLINSVFRLRTDANTKITSRSQIR